MHAHIHPHTYVTICQAIRSLRQPTAKSAHTNTEQQNAAKGNLPPGIYLPKRKANYIKDKIPPPHTPTP